MAVTWKKLTFEGDTPRITSVASSATPTPNIDTTDLYIITALAEAALFGEPTGTPSDGQKLVIRIKDNSTARALTWNAIYTTGNLPDTTVVGETLYLACIYNNAASKWDVAVRDSSLLSNIVEDTTPQLGGDLEYNNKNQVFNTTLTSDDTASGDIITVTFGESVVFGKLCYPDPTANEWMLALATNAAVKHPALGVALETKADGETGKLLLRGLIRDATYFSAFALGDLLWLSDGTAGSWVNAAPTTSGDIVQHVGWVLAANYAYFNPDYTYIEVA